MQLPQYGHKRRYPGATGYKESFSFVFDHPPGLADNEAIARDQLSDLVGDALVIRVAFYGELQIGVFVETGEGKGPFFALPVRFIDGYLRSLSGRETITGGLFKADAPHVVG